MMPLTLVVAVARSGCPHCSWSEETWQTGDLIRQEITLGVPDVSHACKHLVTSWRGVTMR